MSKFIFQVHALSMVKTQRQIAAVDAKLTTANHGDGPIDRQI